MLFAQLCSGISLMLNFASYQFKTKEKILSVLIPANIFYLLSFLFLGSFSGVITVAIATIRTAVFFLYEKKSKPIPIFAFFVFIFINTILGFVFWEGFVSLLPILGVNVLTYALFQKNENILKYLVIMYCVLFIIFNFFVGGYINILLESVSLSSAAIYIIRKNLNFLQKNKTNY